MTGKAAITVVAALLVSSVSVAEKVTYSVDEASFSGGNGIVASCLCDKPIHVMISVPSFESPVECSFYLSLGIRKVSGNGVFGADGELSQQSGKDQVEISASDPVHFENAYGPTGCTVTVRMADSCCNPRTARIEGRFKVSFPQPSHIEKGAGVIVTLFRNRDCVGSYDELATKPALHENAAGDQRRSAQRSSPAKREECESA